MNYKVLLVLAGVGIATVGAGTGYLLSKDNRVSGITSVNNQMIKSETEVGSTDTKTFRDTATGVLEKNGTNGVGTHKLIREGGPSQTIYMVSSVVDLDQFDGKKVEVWGETQKVAKASWFMDIGRVKIVE
ncbi:MAG: hypothetical protein Q8L51_00815 [Candidatus Amesbacteria bacterium]|nr:hypothetical protein [Candidatus Amesbacteria bacterium]